MQIHSMKREKRSSFILFFQLKKKNLKKLLIYAWLNLYIFIFLEAPENNTRGHAEFLVIIIFNKHDFNYFG